MAYSAIRSAVFSSQAFETSTKFSAAYWDVSAWLPAVTASPSKV